MRFSKPEAGGRTTLLPTVGLPHELSRTVPTERGFDPGSRFCAQPGAKCGIREQAGQSLVDLGRRLRVHTVPGRALPNREMGPSQTAADYGLAASAGLQKNQAEAHLLSAFFDAAVQHREYVASRVIERELRVRNIAGKGDAIRQAQIGSPAAQCLFVEPLAGHHIPQS